MRETGGSSGDAAPLALYVDEVLPFINRACKYRKWCRFTQNPLWSSNTGRGDSVPEDCCFAGCAGRVAGAARRENSVKFPAARRMIAAIAAALRLLSRREGFMTRVGMVSPNPLPPLGSASRRAPRFTRRPTLRECGLSGEHEKVGSYIRHGQPEVATSLI